MRLKSGMALAAVVGAVVAGAGRTAMTQARPRNVIVFVADGLRRGSVTERDTPALWKIRTEGVDFENSYSLFPTFTMANASAIATGHGLGDTGTFSNYVWLGYPSFVSGNFGLGPGTPVAFLENDQVLADFHDHFGGTFLGEETLLDLAAAHGYNTAAVGKVGPVAMQTPTAIAAAPGGFPIGSATIVVDDATGTANAPALPPRLLALLGKERIAPEAPGRTNGYGVTSAYSNGNSGTNTRTGTLAANVVQQQWFTDVATRGILPLFGAEPDKPFAIVLWSRDPDGTQHNQGDSRGTLFPGINGPTSRDGVQNADRTLARLLAWLDAHPDTKANTDVVVTSDHGFATISRREIDRTGRPTASQSAAHDYEDGSGVVDTEKGTLPPGFLAIDLALDLHLGLFDPDRRTEGSRAPYHRVRLTYDTWEHPALGNGLIATDVFNADGSDATAIVAANGGSDLIYVPSRDAERVKQIAALLLQYDYVGSVFVDDQYAGARAHRAPDPVPIPRPSLA